MRVKFGLNGTKDVPLTEVTPENYIVPAGEENTFHVIQEITTFDQRTGKRLSKPRVQKYGAKEYKTIARILKQQGYDLTVLYDPTDFLKKQEAEAEERKLLVGAKKRELEQKRYEAEKAKMKAEILAELKEAGIIQQKPKEEGTETVELNGKSELSFGKKPAPKKGGKK